MTTENAMQLFQRLKGQEPASVCDCGHTGDGPNSQHRDRFAQGHGGCTVKGCKCRQFTWNGWTPEIERKLADAKRKSASAGQSN